MTQRQQNDNLVLICGPSKAGKSTSLRDMPDPEGVMYLNCEAGKKLTFPANFKQFTITDPMQVFQYFNAAEDPRNAKCHTIVVDSLTYLMEMFESVHVLKTADTMKGWSNYQQYFKTLMQNYVAKSTKNVFFTAHTLAIYNGDDMMVERKVPIKGALKNVGIESYFSVVVTARTVPMSTLADYKNDLLHINPDEEMIGVKHVFQTRLTKDTVNERIGGPIDMWSQQETYIDNSCAALIKRLHEYYQ